MYVVGAFDLVGPDLHVRRKWGIGKDLCAVIVLMMWLLLQLIFKRRHRESIDWMTFRSEEDEISRGIRITGRGNNLAVVIQLPTGRNLKADSMLSRW